MLDVCYTDGCTIDIIFNANKSALFVDVNKMLSCRKETALQGALVLAKSGRLELGEYFTDIIGLSSTTVT